MVAGGGDDVEVGVAGGEGVGGCLGFGEGVDWLGDEGGELGPVRGDPGDEGQEVEVEGLEGRGWKEVVAGGGTEDGVEHDGDGGGGLIPCHGLGSAGTE